MFITVKQQTKLHITHRLVSSLKSRRGY